MNHLLWRSCAFMRVIRGELLLTGWVVACALLGAGLALMQVTA